MGYPAAPRLHRMQRGGLAATVMDWGATLLSLQAAVPGERTRRELLLRLSAPEAYACQGPGRHLNATLGRYAGCIARSRFELGGREYRLHGEGSHCFNGGREGFDRRRFTFVDTRPASATLALCSPDQDQGFPGTMELYVTLALHEGCALSISYTAKCDRPCYASITCAAAFNLSGCTSSVLDHALQLRAAALVECDGEQVPTGSFTPLSQAPAFDFREGKKLGLDFMNDPRMQAVRGYDHAFLLAGGPDPGTPCARLISADERVMLELATDYPCLQLSTCNQLHHGQELTAADGAILPNHAGVCLMPGFCPDAMHLPRPATAAPVNPMRPLQRSIIYRITCS